jgi:hypothetical protein
VSVFGSLTVCPYIPTNFVFYFTGLHPSRGNRGRR